MQLHHHPNHSCDVQKIRCSKKDLMCFANKRRKQNDSDHRSHILSEVSPPDSALEFSRTLAKHLSRHFRHLHGLALPDLLHGIVRMISHWFLLPAEIGGPACF